MGFCDAFPMGDLPVEETEPTIWTVILKAPNGGIHIEEVEADELETEVGISARPDYVLKTYNDPISSDEVARFPRESVLGIYRGRRKQLVVTIQTEKEQEH